MMENTMKCPYCGNELRKGYIQSGRIIFFTEKIHKFSFIPNLSKESEVVLSSNNMTYPNCNALHCLACKKVIIDYSTIKQEI